MALGRNAVFRACVLGLPAAAAILSLLFFAGRPAAQQAGSYHKCPTLRVERIGDGPIIHAGLKGLEGKIGENITGPSLIRVPKWVKNPLGKYYLYFAHHKGRYIRLAYADNLRGPWTIYEGGVLPVEGAPVRDHVASPDIYVDEKAKSIHLYFHGVKPDAVLGDKEPQATYLATSSDGLSFTINPTYLAPPYLRIFKHRQSFYGIVKTASGGQGSVVYAPRLFTAFDNGPAIIERMRHAAVHLPDGGKTALIAFTRIGDAPESIYYSCMDLSGDYRKWEATTPHLLMKPERDYEGADEPVIPSKENFVMGSVNQLRDPAFFESYGKLFLLYSTAGESGIGLAEVKIVDFGDGTADFYGF